MLSIVHQVIHHAQAYHLTRLLLLGIKYTMQADFYQRAGLAAGIEIITPAEPEQSIINDIIFDELVLGIFKPASKAVLLNIIERYPVDGVILGCTELPLAIKQADLTIRAIDTLDLHAEAALRYALHQGEEHWG
jgi:aspartate racemase